MRLRNLAALVAVTLLAALPAVAQENRGSIEGVVKDAQGGAVVGATVVARMARPSRPEERVYGGGIEVVTDATGTYRFPALAPGRYELTANLSGFAPAKVANIDLRLGQQLTINLTPQPGRRDRDRAGRRPSRRSSPSPRAPGPPRSATRRSRRCRRAATSCRSITQASGANMETKSGTNAIMIDGSSGGENRWIIDGAESTNLQSGAQGKQMVTDFVEEVQVKSSGYTAEYGGSTGGVINVLSKSGTQPVARRRARSTTSRMRSTPPRARRCASSPTNDRESEYVTYAEDAYDRVEPGFNLSGPIVKDKVWFFAGYIPSFRPLDRTVTFRSDGSTNTFRENITSNYLSTNLTAQFGPQWRMRAAYNLSNGKTEGSLPALDGTSSPTQSYDQNFVRPNWAASMTIDYTPSNKVFMSLRGGYYYRDNYTEGVYDGDQVQYFGSSVGVARCAGRVAAGERLSERDHQQRPDAGQAEALPAPVRHDVLLLGRRRAPAEGRRRSWTRSASTSSRASRAIGSRSAGTRPSPASAAPTATTRCAATARSRTRGSSPRAT